MKNPCVFFLTAFLAMACTTTYDPLEEYEEMTRELVIEAPPVEPTQAGEDDPELIKQ